MGYLVCYVKDGFIQVEQAPESEKVEGGEEVDDKKVPKSYKEMEKLCIDGQCRYAFYTFKWQSGGGPRDMIVMIQYCDDNAGAKQKLTYSTSTSALKKGCNGIGAVIEANDKDEIDYFEILEKCKKMKRKVVQIFYLTQIARCSN